MVAGQLATGVQVLCSPPRAGPPRRMFPTSASTRLQTRQLARLLARQLPRQLARQGTRGEHEGAPGRFKDFSSQLCVPGRLKLLLARCRHRLRGAAPSGVEPPGRHGVRPPTGLPTTAPTRSFTLPNSISRSDKASTRCATTADMAARCLSGCSPKPQRCRVQRKSVNSAPKRPDRQHRGVAASQGLLQAQRSCTVTSNIPLNRRAQADAAARRKAGGQQSGMLARPICKVESVCTSLPSNEPKTQPQWEHDQNDVCMSPVNNA